MRNALLLAALIGLLPASPARADDGGITWVSVPRAGITIVVGKDGSRVSGPDWERTFEAGATSFDFEIVPGRRMVLRRIGDIWAGEYFHPRIRPGKHAIEQHIMTFDRRDAAPH